MRSIWACGVFATALSVAGPCAAQSGVSVSAADAPLYHAVADQLRTLPEPTANAPNRRFHSVAIANIFYPGDQASIFDNRLYDSRTSTRYDATSVERWYIAQVPDNAPFVRRDAEAEVLYLPPCRAPGLYDLDLDVGDSGVADIDPAIVERIWIHLALSRLGLNDIEIPEFSLRKQGAARQAPDPGVVELNRRISARIAQAAVAPASDDSGRLVLVLEGYCGPRNSALQLPNLIPELHPAPVYPPPAWQPNYYRLQMPTNVTSGVSAGLLWAEACRIRTGSRTNTSCPRWSPVANGVPLQGRGQYRLVATLNGQPRSFRYTVLPMHLGNGDAPPVPVIPEP